MSVLLIVNKTHTVVQNDPQYLKHRVLAVLGGWWLPVNATERKKRRTIQTAIAFTTNKNLLHDKTVERVKWSRSGDCYDDE